MKKKGQLQLEAVICIAVFLAILTGFIGAANSASLEAEEAVLSLGAKTRAEACCILTDSVYSTGIFEEIKTGLNCKGDGEKTEASAGGKGRTAECIAREIRTVQEGEKNVLEVSANAHYR